MNQVLSRGEYQPWATRWPVSSLGAMLITAVVGIGIFTYSNTQVWAPLQQWYRVQHLDTKLFPTARGDYRLLANVDAHGKQLMAVDADVAPGPMQGWPPFPFALTPKARQRGAATLKVDTVHSTSAQMNQMLLEGIYEGQTPDDLIRPTWVDALLVLVVGLTLAIARDRARRRNPEEGRRLKGPQMVTVREFNQWSGADGISFLTTESRQLLSLPRSLESSHIMIMGDTGAATRTETLGPRVPKPFKRTMPTGWLLLASDGSWARLLRSLGFVCTCLPFMALWKRSPFLRSD